MPRRLLGKAQKHVLILTGFGLDIKCCQSNGAFDLSYLIIDNFRLMID